MTAVYQRTKPTTNKVAWMEDAACAGEDIVLFFGEDGERQPERDIRERQAKQVCAVCPVSRDCLDYALTTGQAAGMWGGLNEDERKSMARRLARRNRAA
jgi:WhiB family redox-sensing transcriptional regulator